MAHRLKILHDVRAPVLPGCLTAFFDLYRGIPRHLAFDPDATAGALPRAIAALPQGPEGTLVVGDRLYGVGAFFTALTARGLSGVCRRNARQSWQWVRDLRQTPLADGVLWDTVVTVPGKRDHPPQSLRWLRWRKGRESRELLTNVLLRNSSRCGWSSRGGERVTELGGFFL